MPVLAPRAYPSHGDFAPYPSSMPRTSEGTKQTRALASVDRTGAFAKGKARRRHRQFVTRNWRWLLLLDAVVVLAFAPSAALSSGVLRGFFLGVSVSTAISLDVVAVLLLSGTAGVLMGELAEGWTASEVQGLAKSGWRLINRVRFRRYGDIDHIAFGPAGAVVLESKWSSEPWAESRELQRRLRNAAERVVADARDLRLMLRQQGYTVRSAIVLWTVGSRDEPTIVYETVGELSIVNGHRLQEWMCDAGAAATQDEVEAAWSRVAKHVARRDAFDRETEPPVPPSFSETVTGLVSGVFGALAAVFVVATVAQWQPQIWLWVPTLVATITTGTLLRRTTSFHARCLGTGAQLAGIALAVTLSLVMGAAYVMH